MEFEALIPAGGVASRLDPLPCSKEIFPLTGQFILDRVIVFLEKLAVWKSSHANFMHKFLSELITHNSKGTRLLDDGSERELYVGDVITEAMRNGLKISYVMFENGFSSDIGTHEEMSEFLKNH